LLLDAFNSPCIENLGHKSHPLLGGSLEVVFDGSIYECNEVVLLMVRRDGDVLFVESGWAVPCSVLYMLTDTVRGSASVKILSRAL
jgi:hypothetical protein